MNSPSRGRKSVKTGWKDEGKPVRQVSFKRFHPLDSDWNRYRAPTSDRENYKGRLAFNICPLAFFLLLQEFEIVRASRYTENGRKFLYFRAMFFLENFATFLRAILIILSPSPEPIGTEKNSLDRFVREITETGSQAKDRLTSTADRLHDSLDRTFHGAEQLGNSAANTLQRSIDTSFTNWLNAHPVLSWTLSHPILSLILLVLSLLLFWLLFSGLFRAIGSFSERFWLALFLLPLKLSRGLFGAIARNSFRVTDAKLSASEKERRLAFILHRLQEIEGEQKGLLQEMAEILELQPDRVQELTNDRLYTDRTGLSPGKSR